MKGIEFYIYNNELWYMADGENKQLTENDTVIIGTLLSRIMQLYPDAYKALAKEYKRSALNAQYYQYLIVRRFCKCNFGTLDNTRKDISINGTFNFESVACPLRGECIHDGIICNPKPNIKLTDAEYRVMKLLYEGYSNMECAETLYMSYEKVKMHAKNVYKKLGLREKADFIKYAEKTNLFN